MCCILYRGGLGLGVFPVLMPRSGPGHVASRTARGDDTAHAEETISLPFHTKEQSREQPEKLCIHVMS